MFSCNASNSSMCFWDKHPFTGEGVVCPLYFKPKQTVTKKREYYINHNIPAATVPPPEDVVINARVISDCKFCSDACCAAWIEDNKHLPEFRSSRQIFETLKERVTRANHWRTIKSFGGFLTIDEFRKNNRRFEMVSHGIDCDQKFILFKEVYVVD
ncbi:hypothetical protein AV955_gp108 [Diadromus pulchellus ascovirus 4a]|uniref:Complete DpAV4 genome n=1 Tax=Diadromus pulchellus ascovirus 4a TaxID=158683 RepID=F2NZ37_9VIRU|nr:hypothetical protein AV955_gp108 [Diadromus pulchellus ascovirus 4a]CCA61465.1 unnamed protein product [Diadromus pulchellus ascovirus 4a]